MTSTHDKQHKHNAKPTKHAIIMRGVVAPIFGLLAVLFIVLGALNATVWKPARQVNASASIPGVRYVVTDPGVLNLLSKSVNLRVKTDTGSAKALAQSDNNGGSDAAIQTCVALGSAKDAAGWLAGQDYTRVTGLDGWKAFSTKTATGPKLVNAKGGDEVAFKDSDMWTSVRCGDNAIALTLNDVKSDQVMIVDMGAPIAGSTDSRKSAHPSVSITMHWVRDQVPDHATPFFIVGGVCVVLTILSASVFAITANESFRRRRDQRRKLREKAKAEEVSISEAMTGSIAVLRTSLVHSSHNHRPSHKIRPADNANTSESTSDTSVAGPSNDVPLFTADNAADDDEGMAVPSIIDPTRRNLVADMQMQNDADEIGEDSDDADDNGAAAAIGGVSNTGKAGGFEQFKDSQDSQNPHHDKFTESGSSAGDDGDTSQADTDSGEQHVDEIPVTHSDDGANEVAKNAEAADETEAGEAEQLERRFGRHRGKAEQESESDLQSDSFQPTHIGRHSRHTAVRADQPEQLEQGVEPAAASVAVSLDLPDVEDRHNGEEHARHDNGEARRASSADELIDKSHSIAETDVISMDELRNYFARFSQETSKTYGTLTQADGRDQDADGDNADDDANNTDGQKPARQRADQPMYTDNDERDEDGRSGTAQETQKTSDKPSDAGQDGEKA